MIKYVRFFAVILFTSVVLIACSDKKEVPVSGSELPAPIKSYIEQHFSGTTISEILDNLPGGGGYQIQLSNGMTVRFTKEGRLIQMKGAEIPQSALPQKMLTYLNENFSNSKAIGWELFDNNREQGVTLSDGVEVIFDLGANPVRSHGDEDDVPIADSDLPAKAQAYLQKYFAQVAISRVWKDRDGFTITYELYLQNGAYLEFDEDGEPIEVEYARGLPTGIIPSKIEEYLRVNFASSSVTKWELEANERKQEITLDNQRELLFDLDGNFIGSEENDGDTLIPTEELPEISFNYIRTHFPGSTILQVWKEQEGARVSYEVRLINGEYIEFNGRGEPVEVESYYGLPEAVIPAKISSYIAGKFPGIKITKWELDGQYQELTLINGLELVFDSAGNFVKIDD